MAKFTTKERDDLAENLDEVWEALEKIHYLLDEVWKFFENTDADDQERKRAWVFVSLLSDEIYSMQSYMPSADWAKNMEAVEN